MAQTIFQKIGGFSTVSRVVSDFYDRVLDSEKVGDFFEDIAMDRLIDHQTKFMASLMGGPASYSDDQVAHAHAQLDVDADSFDELVDILCSTLADHGVASADVDLIRAEVEGRRQLIVKA